MPNPPAENHTSNREHEDRISHKQWAKTKAWKCAGSPEQPVVLQSLPAAGYETRRLRTVAGRARTLQRRNDRKRQLSGIRVVMRSFCRPLRPHPLTSRTAEMWQICFKEGLTEKILLVPYEAKSLPVSEMRNALCETIERRRPTCRRFWISRAPSTVANGTDTHYTWSDQFDQLGGRVHVDWHRTHWRRCYPGTITCHQS